MAQLAVRDTGRGLSADDLGRVFEAFYTTKPHGMGIGLSVSKSIIDRHEGKLWARPDDAGGAVFAFSVPYAPGASAPIGEPAA
jgi:signal transduction histidine kinase